MNPNSTNLPTTRVAVVGGGYAGVLAANRLQRPGLDVTLINPRPEFVERIRLHQLVAGNHSATVRYAGLLGPDVRLMVDAAERIDAPGRRILLASGREVGYDYLIYAVGSTGGTPEFAHGLSELEDAQRLRDRLAGLAPGAPVVVVGAGLTGIETAAELAGRGCPVSLVGTVGPALAPSGRRSVTKRLRALGVDVVGTAQVRTVADDHVTLSDGRTLPSAATVWTAGFGVPGLAAASGLSVDDIGRLRTDETLTSVDDPRIVAAGDCAAPSGLPLRMSCQAAMPMAAQAAQTVLARVAGVEPAVLNQAFASQCISLGRTAGTVQFSRADDTPRSLFIGGRAGAFIKEKICRYTVTALRREGAAPGAYTWFKSGWRRDRLAPADVAAIAR